MMYLPYTIILLLGAAFSEAQQRSCTPAQSNTTTTPADDVPAILAAFKECGEGGTILFPSFQTYYIGSPLDLAVCKGCTIQIDGTLNITAIGTPVYQAQNDVFQLEGATNLTINGSGLINGGYNSPSFMFNMSSASNIRISGLTIRSPASTIFYIRDSREIQASSLSLAAYLDPNNPPSKYSSWISAFDIKFSSHIDISQTNITGVSNCVEFGSNVNSSSVSNLNCSGGGEGVYINLQTAGPLEEYLYNLSFTNLTIEGAYSATGIGARGGIVTAENVTWQNVRVHRVMVPTHVFGCAGSGCGGPNNPGATFILRNISFVNFRGQSRVGQRLDCPWRPGRECDLQVRDFNVEVSDWP